MTMQGKAQALATLCLALIVPLAGCSGDRPQATSSATPTPITEVASPSPEASPSPSPQVDTYEQALDVAYSAASLTQSAQGKDDWDLVVGRWQEATDLMKAVPKESKNHAAAQKKAGEYQKNLAVAKRRAANPGAKAAAVAASNPSPASTGSSKDPRELMQAFMEQYFDATANRGTKGYEYWCSDFRELDGIIGPASVIAPRSWELLNIELESRGANKKDGRGEFIGIIRARAESSTEGGIPVINNWSFNVIKEIPSVKNDSPGRYCITALSKG
jgi:hypothetical protein